MAKPRSHHFSALLIPARVRLRMGPSPSPPPKSFKHTLLSLFEVLTLQDLYSEMELRKNKKKACPEKLPLGDGADGLTFSFTLERMLESGYKVEPV